MEYIDTINNKKIFAERTEYTKYGKNIDSELNEIDANIMPLIPGDNINIITENGNIKIYSPYSAGPIGPEGIQGFCGPQGLCGPRGFCGPQGLIGNIGSTGPQVTGLRGVAGFCGPKGFCGPQGLCGPLGPSGPKGPCGPLGLIGNTGPQGAKGFCGPLGFCGPRGFCGPQGPSGTKGPSGPLGPSGNTGPQATGLQGVSGFCGPKGFCGPQGFCGPRGLMGSGGKGFTNFHWDLNDTLTSTYKPTASYTQFDYWTNTSYAYIIIYYITTNYTSPAYITIQCRDASGNVLSTQATFIRKGYRSFNTMFFKPTADKIYLYMKTSNVVDSNVLTIRYRGAYFS